MPTIFDTAFESLLDTLEAVAGVDVVVSRKVGASWVLCPTVAHIGRTVFRRSVTARGGPSIEFGDRDFLIRVKNYCPGGLPVEPAEGDRIQETETGKTFEVLRIPDEPAHRYSEPERLTWRVHTKEMPPH